MADIGEPKFTYTLPDGLEIGPIPGTTDTVAFWLMMVNDNARPVPERISAFIALVQLGVQLEVIQKHG